MRKFGGRLSSRLGMGQPEELTTKARRTQSRQRQGYRQKNSCPGSISNPLFFVSFVPSWLTLLLFRVQQLFLAGHAPAVAGQFAVGADDPVARDDHRDRVGGARPGHAPAPARGADLLPPLLT